MSEERLLNERHSIGYDPIVVGLREKYYAEGHPVIVRAKSGRAGETEGELTRLCIIDESEQKDAFKCLIFPGSYLSPSLIGSKNWGTAEWRQLFDTLRKTRRWDICRFNLLDQVSADMLAERARENGFRIWKARSYFNVIPDRKSWTDYLKTRRSSFNRNQNRCRRLMDAQGFAFSESLDFDQIVSVYSARSGILGEGDYSLTPKFLGFLKDLRDAMIAEGRWLEVGVVRDEKLAAFTLGFWGEGDAFYFFQTSYDPEFHSLRLGALTFDHLLQSIMNRGCSLVSFLGSSRYFEHFSKETLDYHTVDVFSTTSKAWSIYLRRTGYRGATQVICAWQKFRARISPKRKDPVVGTGAWPDVEAKS